MCKKSMSRGVKNTIISMKNLASYLIFTKSLMPNRQEFAAANLCYITFRGIEDDSH